MNRPNVAPQSLRGMPGFLSQQQQQQQQGQQQPSRPLGGSRLTNGKLGSGSGWGFGAPIGAPGLQHPQARSNASGLPGLPQSIGGSQNATSLDPSEFPSLSAAPAQPQNNTNAQPTWGTQNQRTTHTPVQRPQQNNGGGGGGGVPNQQHRLHQEDLFPSSSQFANGLDDYRYGGQSAGQMGNAGGGGGGQPQTANIDEFPPLGRSGNGELGQDRQGGLMSGSGFGQQQNGNGFGQPFGQHSQGLLSRNNGFSSIGDGSRQGNIGDSITSPVGTGGLSASRSPDPSFRPGATSRHDDQNILSRQNPQSLFASMPSSQSSNNGGPRSQRSFPSHLQQQDSRQGQQQFDADFGESPQATQPADEQSLAQMSDIDKYGLKGLLAIIRHESSDIGSLAVGQDLTALGLDLNQPEPLHSTFASPFASPNGRPVEPDFKIPACYSVSNVMPLQQKAPSFSEETLFFMFYSTPRDISQEIAASELTARGWRYHKTHQRWLTKEATSEPLRLSSTEERGMYVFFDPSTWQKTRKEIVLRYDDLDQRANPPFLNTAATTTPATPSNGGMPGGGGGSVLSAGGIGGGAPGLGQGSGSVAGSGLGGAPGL